MQVEEKIATIKAIREVNPNHLMAKYFDEEAFLALSPENRAKLMDIFASGVANPNSIMGAYVHDATDYERFAAFLDPMIRDYHGYPDNCSLVQSHDWDIDSCNVSIHSTPNEDLSIRIRIARNLDGFSLPSGMTTEDRIRFEEMMISALKDLNASTGINGKYYSLTPGSEFEITPEKYEELQKKGLIFKDVSKDKYMNVTGIANDWPIGRGIYVSEKEDIVIWINEEDHLRIATFGKVAEIKDVLKKLKNFAEKIEEYLPVDYSYSSKYGYVTSCPTNLGTGMRASVHMPVPVFTDYGKYLDDVNSFASDRSLSIRGVGGEHTSATGGVIDVSPSIRLGASERDIVVKLVSGINTLSFFESLPDPFARIEDIHSTRFTLSP